MTSITVVVKTTIFDFTTGDEDRLKNIGDTALVSASTYGAYG